MNAPPPFREVASSFGYRLLVYAVELIPDFTLGKWLGLEWPARDARQIADKISKVRLKLGLLFQPWILADERPSLLPPHRDERFKLSIARSRNS